jgi:nucleoside-diphosphate-sugar epimerase
MTPSFWAGRRGLVTGHTGFNGSWLSLWLADARGSVIGYSEGVPTTPSRYEAAAVEETLTSVLGDVRDRAKLRGTVKREGPEIVFHLAAQPLVRRAYVGPALTYETSVLGTLNLLEASRAVDDLAWSSSRQITHFSLTLPSARSDSVDHSRSRTLLRSSASSTIAAFAGSVADRSKRSETRSRAWRPTSDANAGSLR